MPIFFSRPHSTMAEICLTYLDAQLVEALSADPCPDTRGHSLSRILFSLLGSPCERELSDHAKSLALNLFHERDGHISTKLLIGQVEHLTL